MYETTMTKEMAVEQIIEHPGFVFDTLINDIALLKLEVEVDLRMYTPVCLPDPGSTYTGKNAWVYGWGLQENGQYASKLHDAEVSVVSSEVCKDSLLSSDAIKPGMLCAGAPGKDACHVDSGGPLTYANNSQHELIGVVSWGSREHDCAAEGTYGVYAKVSDFMPWLTETMANNGGVVLTCADPTPTTLPTYSESNPPMPTAELHIDETTITTTTTTTTSAGPSNNNFVYLFSYLNISSIYSI